MLGQQLAYPWFIYYDGAYKGTSKATFRKMLDLDSEGFKVVNLADLPASCAEGNARIVRDASTKTGNLPLFVCDAANHWLQWGFQADGTGYLTITCEQPGVCLVGPNTAVLGPKVRYVDQQPPFGITDGVNRTFTLLGGSPDPADSLMLFQNGLMLTRCKTNEQDEAKLCDYMLFNDRITYVDRVPPPPAGAILTASYRLNLVAQQ